MLTQSPSSASVEGRTNASGRIIQQLDTRTTLRTYRRGKKVIPMFMRKKNHAGRQSLPSDTVSSEENLQSVRNWIRKIEQSTASVSSRLLAVEKRISCGVPGLQDGLSPAHPAGNEREMSVGKKRATQQQVHLLEQELARIHGEVTQQQQHLLAVQEQCTVMQQHHDALGTQVQVLHQTLAAHQALADERLQHLSRLEPFVMRLGRLEIPVEFTGVIGGLLAFSIAILVVGNQHALLLSPVFLVLVGLLLLGSAMIKTVRCRSHGTLPSQPTPSPLVCPTVLPGQTREEKQ
ncbi:MAG: hypothetical protein JXA00_01905 [Candidatus Thermoplasmatota archaeon]|nr:hypothetical protein [Candidatus Thermoplasmatota archaeon]